MAQTIRQAASDGETFARLVWQGEAREPFIIFAKTLSKSGFIFDQADAWSAVLKPAGVAWQAQACERAPASGRGEVHVR
jgi:hypothetical protein